MIDFVLVVPVVGQEGQVDKLEEQLQIRPAGGYDEGGVGGAVIAAEERTLGSQGGLAGPDAEIGAELTVVSGALIELQYTAERIPVSGSESTGTELHPVKKGYVEQSYRSAGAALGGKMVDTGNFDGVKVIDVLVGSAPRG